MAAVRVSRVTATSAATTARPTVRVSTVFALNGSTAASAVRVSRVVALNGSTGPGSTQVIYLRASGAWVPVPLKTRRIGVFVDVGA